MWNSSCKKYAHVACRKTANKRQGPQRVQHTCTSVHLHCYDCAVVHAGHHLEDCSGLLLRLTPLQSINCNAFTAARACRAQQCAMTCHCCSLIAQARPDEHAKMASCPHILCREPPPIECTRTPAVVPLHALVLLQALGSPAFVSAEVSPSRRHVPRPTAHPCAGTGSSRPCLPRLPVQTL